MAVPARHTPVSSLFYCVSPHQTEHDKKTLWRIRSTESKLIQFVSSRLRCAGPVLSALPCVLPNLCFPVDVSTDLVLLSRQYPPESQARQRTWRSGALQNSGEQRAASVATWRSTLDRSEQVRCGALTTQADCKVACFLTTLDE
ncbi:hypothetical protein DIPPA_54709 [Diplonema papillatum]|nr:hypothetical protein DIPPA_54709 [Diplonema papillatum]